LPPIYRANSPALGLGEPLTVRYPDCGSAIGTIEEIVPDQRLVFSWGYSDPAKNLPPNASVSSSTSRQFPSGTFITLRRAALLAQCWDASAIFRDAMGYAEGREDLTDYIGAAQSFPPNVAFERLGPLPQVHGHTNYRWRMVAPDGSVMMTGNNVAELSPDGLFLSMTGFWDPPTPASDRGNAGVELSS
jgi:hypothetical protein